MHEIRTFPSSQRRGSATAPGWSDRGKGCRSSLEASPCRARASRHPVCAFGASTPPLRGGEYGLEHLIGSMAIIILTVHDVRAPGEEANILGYLFKFIRLRIDDHDRVF